MLIGLYYHRTRVLAKVNCLLVSIRLKMNMQEVWRIPFLPYVIKRYLKSKNRFPFVNSFFFVGRGFHLFYAFPCFLSSRQSKITSEAAIHVAILIWHVLNVDNEMNVSFMSNIPIYMPVAQTYGALSKRVYSVAFDDFQLLSLSQSQVWSKRDN
ncbi:hypothetical protein EGR_09243 [Echinococcus granulosus]|uniref:Uncharacterized protein n=1 Tax=Echinococcus granulosus TaxID=6210 RepID=W6U5M0_ECHGR|nr:hypothetical protein EGR_09243 [Echinococcus granulosus]EUB55886.1 hypothetical protein EGR_09243 [Echinococcus granulosus]